MPASLTAGADIVARAVRTLVISDLHLGASTRADLLRRPDLREPLIDAAHGVDRVVILGDGLGRSDGSVARGVPVVGVGRVVDGAQALLDDLGLGGPDTAEQLVDPPP